MKLKAIKHIGLILLDILIAFIIIFAFIITILTVISNKDGIPSIGGYSFFTVESNSMYPTLKKGDFIVDKKVNIDKLKAGDIISYFASEKGTNIIKTHRIEYITFEDTYLITTKGDNNNTIDSVIVTEVDYVGKYNDIRIPLLGYLIDFLKSTFGFLFCILIPLAIIFIYQFVDVIKLLVNVKEEAK